MGQCHSQNSVNHRSGRALKEAFLIVFKGYSTTEILPKRHKGGLIKINTSLRRLSPLCSEWALQWATRGKPRPYKFPSSFDQRIPALHTHCLPPDTTGTRHCGD